MRINQPHSQHRIRSMSTLITLFVFVFLGCSQKALGQWTTNGNDINSTNSGNVGIGTTTPLVKFHLQNASTAQARIESTGTAAAALDFKNTSRRWVIGAGLLAGGGDFSIYDANAALTRMYVDTSGNVGIGTTAPDYPLTIVKNHNGPTAVLAFNTADGASAQTSGGVSRTTDFSSKYLTYGVTAPSFSSPGYGETAYFHAAGVPIKFGTNSANDLYFFTNGIANTRMTVSSAGNVGIGTVAPTHPLEVTAPAVINNGSRELLALYDTTSFGAGVGGGITFGGKFNAAGTIAAQFVSIEGIKENGTDGDFASAFRINTRLNGGNPIERFRISSGGNVGIGISNTVYRLDVQGGQINTSGGLCIAGDCKTAWSQVGGGGGTITAVTAGAGLTGGGTSGAVTLDIGAGTGLSVAADNVSVNYGSTAGTAVQGNTSITVSPGAGLSGGGSLTLGAGGSLTLTNADTGSSQSIFKNIANAGGTTQFSAGSNNSSLRFQGNGGTTVSFDASANKVIIDGSTSTIAAPNVTAGQFGAGNYTFPGNVTVNGNIAAKYQDMAEWVPAAHALPAGTVTVLDPSQSNQVMASAQAYDTRVAGVISEQPGIVLGEAGSNKVLVATTGRVRVKVDATRGPIRIGDLLVTSDIEGLAMKSEPLSLGGVAIHRPGTLIGKALEPLEKGRGEILVLLSLQ